MWKSRKHVIPLFMAAIFMIFGLVAPFSYASLIGWGGALVSLMMAIFLILREEKAASSQQEESP